MPASGRHYPAEKRFRPAASVTGSENDVALSVGCALRAEATLVDLPVPFGIDQQHRAGAGAIVVAADEGRAQPALAFQSDAGVGQVAVGGAMFVRQGTLPVSPRRHGAPRAVD